ncbi:hypothetical protein BDZ89DRAFT_1042459 [Hymenopellis radicata]|nr:hypothetical protein BDZ89DRAFT_1042459 [Hymenopellis radicata]
MGEDEQRMGIGRRRVVTIARYLQGRNLARFGIKGEKLNTPLERYYAVFACFKWETLEKRVKSRRKRTAKKVSGFIKVGGNLTSFKTPYKFVRVELQRQETGSAAESPAMHWSRCLLRKTEAYRGQQMLSLISIPLVQQICQSVFKVAEIEISAAREYVTPHDQQSQEIGRFVSNQMPRLVLPPAPIPCATSSPADSIAPCNVPACYPGAFSRFNVALGLTLFIYRV